MAFLKDVEINRPNDCNGGETLDIRSEVLDVRSETLDVSGGMLKSNDYRLMSNNYRLKSRNGFDIVIGNPPYFKYEGTHKGEIDNLKKQKELKSAFGGKLNAYKLFLAKALSSLVADNGIICYIFQNSFLADQQATVLRKQVFKTSQIISIDSYPERDNPKKRVFESVKMSVCIPLIKKCKSDNSTFLG